MSPSFSSISTCPFQISFCPAQILLRISVAILRIVALHGTELSGNFLRHFQGHFLNEKSRTYVPYNLRSALYFRALLTVFACISPELIAPDISSIEITQQASGDEATVRRLAMDMRGQTNFLMAGIETNLICNNTRHDSVQDALLGALSLLLWINII